MNDRSHVGRNSASICPTQVQSSVRVGGPQFTIPPTSFTFASRRVDSVAQVFGISSLLVYCVDLGRNVLKQMRLRVGAMQRVHKVALIIETSKAFGRGLLLSISRYAHLHGRWSLFVEERGLDDPIPRWLTSSECDGIILRTRERSLMDEVLRKQIPTVCVGEDNPPGAFSVVNDEASSALLAADHLLERNFRHFGFVGIQDYVWSDARRDAFADKVRSAGYDCDILEPSRKTRRTPRWEPVRRRLADWIQHLRKPSGIMCCYDVMARGVLDVCRELNVSVPEEVAVIGVDNDEVLCEVSQPPLSSVALDTKRIGFEAAAMLDTLMQGGSVDSPVIVAPDGIVTRRSTDTIAVEDRHIVVALAFIRRHACDGIEAGDVVAQVPLSRRTLERRFREQVGCSLLAEIDRVRLQRVKQFLAETDLKLDAIAAHCGFAHTPYMATHFRRQFGLTPGQFRRKCRSVVQSA